MNLKQVLAFFKNNFGYLGSNFKTTSEKILNIIWSQIIDFYFFFVPILLTKDKNFIHWTPLIRSQASQEALNYPTFNFSLNFSVIQSIDYKITLPSGTKTL